MRRDRTGIGRVRLEADLAVRRAAGKGGAQDPPTPYASGTGIASGTSESSGGETAALDEVTGSQETLAGLQPGVNYSVQWEFARDSDDPGGTSPNGEFGGVGYYPHLTAGSYASQVEINPETDAQTARVASWTVYVHSDLAGAIDLPVTPTLTGTGWTGSSTGPLAGVWTVTEIPADSGSEPAAHADTHASGGSDPISPADIGAAAASHEHTFIRTGSGARVDCFGGIVSFQGALDGYDAPVTLENLTFEFNSGGAPTPAPSISNCRHFWLTCNKYSLDPPLGDVTLTLPAAGGGPHFWYIANGTLPANLLVQISGGSLQVTIPAGQVGLVVDFLGEAHLIGVG